MMNQWKYLFGLLLLLLLACNRAGEHEALFRQVESVMNKRPDSAMVLLKRVENPALLSREEMARYYLLWTEAADKAYVEHTTDSLITIATDYYEETDDLMRRAKAWYYRGRINQDLARPLKAQEYYLKALRDEEQIGDYALLGRIHNHIGTLYTYQEVYDKALPHQKEAVENFRLLGDSTGQVFALRDLSRVFLMLGRQDSAMLCDEKAISLMSKRVVLSTYTELASLYMAEQRMDEARELLRTVLRNKAVRPTTKYPAYLVLGNLLRQCGQLDSARYYLQACVDSALFEETRVGALFYLKEIALKQKRWEEAATLAKQYEVVRDSIQAEQRSESIRKYQALYSYEEVERQLIATRLDSANMKYRYALLGIGGIVLFFVVLFYFLQVLRDRKGLRQKLAENKDRVLRNERTIKELSLIRDKLFKDIHAREDHERDLIHESELKFQALRERLSGEINLLREENIALKNWKQEKEERWIELGKTRQLSKFFKPYGEEPSKADWQMLFVFVDEKYPAFSAILEEKHLSELDKKICYLNKVGVKPGRVAILLHLENVSVYRKRLYEKLTGAKGSAKDFDNYISDI